MITGMGLIAPCGIGRQAFWRGMQRPSTYLAPFSRFSLPRAATCYVAEIPDWKPEEHLPRKLVRQTDRHTHFALVAADLAMNDAGLQLDSENPERVGIIVATTLGGMEFAERELYTLWTDSPRAVSAYQSIAWFYAASQGQISIYRGIRGYSKSIVSDRAGGAQALGYAYRVVQEGYADVILAGGTEAPFAPFSMLCYTGAGLVNTGAQSPEQAYLPFDRRAAGIAIGEGAALLVVEEYEHALRRDATIMAEIVGYADTCEALATATSYQAQARQLARAIALATGELLSGGPSIDYIHADGAATPWADMAEVAAIRTSLGSRASSIPISVPKALIGDAIGAGSAFAAAITVLSLVNHCVLPTPHTCAEEQISDLDFVTGAPRRGVLHGALVIARSTGGINAVLCLARNNA